MIFSNATTVNKTVSSRRWCTIKISTEYDWYARIQITCYVLDVRQGYSDLDETDVPT